MSNNNNSENINNKDFRLVELIKQNDSAAFRNLFDIYCQQLINFSRRYVFDKQIAENIVQDIFVRVWVNRERLDSTKSIKSYLYTSVKNESLKYLRHIKVEEKGIKLINDSLNKTLNPETTFDQEEMEKKIISAIDELPGKCREIFSMSRFDQLKYSEIAEILGISIKTVEIQMGRALKKLREKLLHLIMLTLVATSIFYYFL